MSLKKLGLAITVVGLLGAIMASSAFAENTEPKTEGKEWKCGTETVSCISGQGINLKSGLHLLPGGTTSTTATFNVLAGAGGTTEYHLTATGIKCIECKTSNTPTGTATGKIQFTGVTVMSPAGCIVPGGTVTTNSITANADQMHEGGGITTSGAFVKFEPTAGAEKAFATVEVIECPSATNLVVKGRVWCEAVNKTGVAAKEQAITCGTPIHETTKSTLNVNGKTARLEGQAIGSLASGKVFGIN
jgi:hypothetical protein